MRRRDLIGFLGSAAVLWPLAARADAKQQRPLVAWCSGLSETSAGAVVGAFQEGLRELGYDQGVNIEVVYRFGDGRDDRLPALAEELVRLKPAVIVAVGVNIAVATKKLTSTIPIVSGFLADAVHLGLIESYPHPGGNVTGVAPYVEGLPAKQIELVREVIPGAVRVGILGNLNDPKAPPQRSEIEEAGRRLGVSVTAPEIRAPEDLDGAMQALAKKHVDAVIVLQTTMLLSERHRIAALAGVNRLPSIYGYREHVDEGGLISYGVDIRWCSRRTAAYVDKILKGAAPGDLPVEFPTRLQLVINLRTAKALGLKISPLLLSRADEVIEE